MNALQQIILFLFLIFIVNEETEEKNQNLGTKKCIQEFKCPKFLKYK